MTRPGPKRREVDLDELRKLAAKGLPHDHIAALLGMSHETFCDRQREHPEIAEIIQEARCSLQVELVNLLLQQAREGDTRAIRFILERRCGWRNEKTVHHTETVEPKLKLEEIEAKLEAAGYDLEELRRIRRRPPHHN